MKSDRKNSEVPGAEEIIDLEAYTKSGEKPPIGKKYKVKIDEDSFVFEHHIVSRREILEKASRTPIECYTLYQKLKGCDFKKIGPDDKVDLSEEGIEHFVTKPPEVFYYSVDNEPETTDHKELTPDKILELAGVTPVSDYYLVQINHDGSQTSYKGKGDIPIKMVCPGMKFVSVFYGETPVS